MGTILLLALLSAAVNSILAIFIIYIECKER
jgi:hypothetical protein